MNTQTAQSSPAIEVTKHWECTITINKEAFTLKITRPAKSPFANFTEKLLINYRFRSMDGANGLNQWLDGWKKNADSKVNDKAKKIAAIAEAKAKGVNPYMVGQILYDSWGYDQTNIDYFQVVEVKPRSIVVREVNQEAVSTGDMTEMVMPRMNDFKGEPKAKPLQYRYYNGEVTITVNDLSNWNGKPKYASHTH